jgi:hypothetical protein
MGDICLSCLHSIIDHQQQLGSSSHAEMLTKSNPSAISERNLKRFHVTQEELHVLFAHPSIREQLSFIAH